MIIARYNNIIVKCYSNQKMTHKTDKLSIDFICFFEGTDEEFISRYHRDYPNYSFQILNHPRKALRKNARKSIEDFFNTSTIFKEKNREYNLNKLI